MRERGGETWWLFPCMSHAVRIPIPCFRPLSRLVRVIAVALPLATATLHAHAQTSASPDSGLVKECQTRLKPAVIQVRVRHTDIQMDLTKSVADLTRMSKSSLKNMQTLGLAKAGLQYETKWGSETLRSASGEGCLRPSLSIELRAEPHTVYVAREFPKGSCSYNHVLEHEQRHVQANRVHLDWVAWHLRKDLQDFFGQRIFYGKPSQLQQQLKQAVNEHWLKRLNEDMDKVGLRHEAIDTPEEYARNRQACGGELVRLLHARG